MRKAAIIFGACGLLACAPAACGSADNPADRADAAPTETAAASPTPSNEPEATQSRARTTVVKVMNTRYGRMLFDGKGRALYLFTRETSSRARCYGDCAVAWPPFFVRGKLKASAGARAGLLGTTRRRDGRRQVTYRGQPLYYYVSDTKPGEVTCQNVEEFGGTWLVVAPNGRAITAE